MFDYATAFSRNIGLASEEEEEQKLRKTRVAIAGVGGVGGAYALALARLGIGHFHIADLDVFELPNMNRQFGATMSTLNREKTTVLMEMIKEINPTAEVQCFNTGFNAENADAFLSGVQVAVDGIDFFTIDPRVCKPNCVTSLGLL